MIDLNAIYLYANEVLEQADPEEIDGAINWGDLSCTDVQECRSVHGSHSVTVTIEEASPDGNSELREYMYAKLTEKFPEIGYFEINTEW